jgi:hypothetical protein
LAFSEEVGRADLTLTALAVAISALGKVSPDRSGGDLKAMRLLFHELAGDDSDVWEERAAFLVDGDAYASCSARSETLRRLRQGRRPA